MTAPEADSLVNRANPDGLTIPSTRMPVLAQQRSCWRPPQWTQWWPPHDQPGPRHQPRQPLIRQAWHAEAAQVL